MRSMTGFGQAQLEREGLEIDARVRTVNHRQLDLVLQLPEPLRPIEARIAACLRAEFRRGRIETRVEVTLPAERGCRVEVAGEAVAALRRAADELAATGLDDRPLAFADLLKLPEVVRVSRDRFSWTEADHELAVAAVTAARDQAVAARAAEGERLAAVLGDQLDELARLHREIAARGPEARQRLEEGFRQRLDELLAGPPPSDERLAQEVALLVERSDVQEELDRLAAHLEHARELLAVPEPVGRRLVFLGQELLREINTLGSKSRDLPILRRVLDAKVVCDRLREQARNVE